tara:strand:+ start:365 stop:721 length:357 start_codon:yes stop_codon:yes gene_type:complete
MKFFDLSEFDCSHTGANEMDEEFLAYVEELRGACGFPFQITSGYRHETHPEEARKDSPGFHSKGVACDIRVSNGVQRRTIVDQAIRFGFAGIGVANTFVHVDERSLTPGNWSDVLWTY